MTNGNYLTLSDGTELYYKDWGTGQPIVFSHGWPLSSDAFESQMIYLGMKGFRVIAADRRGHGRSGQSWGGNTMDQYADDLAELVKHLNLKDVVHVGHSTGGGEVARYLARHGTGNTKKAILVGAVPPLMLKTEANPNGTPIEVFDGIREGVLNDRSKFFKDLAISFFNVNAEDPADIKEKQGLIDQFWFLGMQGSIKGLYDCVKAFSETDQFEDLKNIDIPTLVLYGDHDLIVPPVASSEAAVKLLPKGTSKVLAGAGHGLCATHKNEVSEIIYQFITKG